MSKLQRNTYFVFSPKNLVYFLTVIFVFIQHLYSIILLGINSVRQNKISALKLLQIVQVSEKCITMNLI